jgi:hypothetical protein
MLRKANLALASCAVSRKAPIIRDRGVPGFTMSVREHRYREGGDSGVVPRVSSRQFKAEVIIRFVAQHEMQSVLESWLWGMEAARAGPLSALCWLRCQRNGRFAVPEGLQRRSQQRGSRCWTTTVDETADLCYPGRDFHLVEILSSMRT